MTVQITTAPMGIVCPDLKRSKRWSTERWLKTMSEQENFEFKYWITISYYKPRKDIIDQYFDNRHIKKVILDFIYKNRKPYNRIRMWIFSERSEMFYRQGKNPHLELIQAGDLHTHILMEGIDPCHWLTSRNRKITIKKSSINAMLQGQYSVDDLLEESLINHLKEHIWRIGDGKQSIDIKDKKDIKKRIHYANKSLSSFEFDRWEHIDFLASDLSYCPIKKPLISYK